MSFEIKKLSEESSAAVAEIEKLCFSHPWSEATVSSEIKSGFSDFFGVFCEGRGAAHVEEDFVVSGFDVQAQSVFRGEGGGEGGVFDEGDEFHGIDALLCKKYVILSERQ